MNNNEPKIFSRTPLVAQPPSAVPGSLHSRGRLCHPLQQRLSVIAVTLLAILLLGLLWWFDPAETNLPLCSFHAMTGLDCPGCGATRATHELLHGRLLAALHYNALWVLSLPLAVYLGVSELRIAAGYRPLPGNLAQSRWFWFSLAAVAMAFFALRNLPWTLLSIPFK